MKKEEMEQVKQAIADIFEEYGITTYEEFESVDEETGMEMYESLNAGVLEEFGVDIKLVDKLTAEILK